MGICSGCPLKKQQTCLVKKRRQKMEPNFLTDKKDVSYPIEVASNDDISQIKNLVSTVLKEYGLSMGSCCSVTDSDLISIEDNYLNRGGYFEVLLDPKSKERKIIGSYGIYKQNQPHTTKGKQFKNVCELRKMYLSKEFRGRGLGRKMMQRAVSTAKAIGFDGMELETATCLKEACELYCSFGFERDKQDAWSSRCNETYFKSLVVNTQS